ncbi:MAG: alkaline phosphatase family protein, partial [Elusimicrobiales bacterium]|nr:alkaline phosphatase family protein [Elusimicrobiales bacterium]
YFLCMTPYVPHEVKLPILFDKEKIKGGLCEYFSEIGVKQFKIAETEKFAHITYFFNGGLKQPFKNEDRVLIQSPREVPTYDHKPQMSAPEVCETLLEKLDDCKHDFYLVNFANCDMVGHTGNYDSVLKAVDIVDDSVGKLVESGRKNGYAIMITADHGNAEEMWDYKTNMPKTSHTTNPVEFIFIDDNAEKTKLRARGILSDIAPTVLNVLGIEKPADMTSQSLLETDE